MSASPTRYDPKTAEPRQQARWADANAFVTKDTGRPKYYVLEMFPYPSGNIHMGHARNYVMGDVVARHKRAQGFDVLHPMGWDAFGMPAENAAMERGIHPKGWTYDNIAQMRAQLKLLGLSLDWSREFATCDPAVLRQAAGLVPGAVSARSGLSQGRHGQLGPGRQHRLGQRAGHRRTRLALGSPGREAQAEPVVPADHRLCRRPDRRAEDAGSLARKSPADAGELDRQVQGRDPVVGHRRGSGLPGERRRRGNQTTPAIRSRSIPPAPTPYSGPAFWPSPPTIP